MLTNKQIESLNDLESRIFSYIITQGKTILKMRISDLALATHVSTTTILRFCKKAGCNGFCEFKIKYRLYLESEKSKSLSRIYGASYLLDYFYNVDNESFNFKIEKVAQKLVLKGNIILIGIGSSGVVAKYGKYIFSAFGINCNYIDDPFYPVPDTDFSDFAIIVLSISGNTNQIIEQTIKYKERNAYVLAITSQEECMLGKFVDDKFVHYLNEEYYGNCNVTSQIPTMFILESLAKKIKQLIIRR